MNQKYSPQPGILLKQLRKNKGLRQTQVASMLGHKNTWRISRFESGTRIPDLETILKLSRIYRTPFMKILDIYITANFAHMRGSWPRRGRGAVSSQHRCPERSFSDGCPYEELMKSAPRGEVAIRSVRKHAADLIRKAAEYMGHI